MEFIIAYVCVCVVAGFVAFIIVQNQRQSQSISLVLQNLIVWFYGVEFFFKLILCNDLVYVHLKWMVYYLPQHCIQTNVNEKWWLRQLFSVE